MSNAQNNVNTLEAISTAADPGAEGFWPDVDAATRVHRMRDRVFMGGAAAFTGNRTGTQSGFIPTATEGANWAPRDSMVLAATDQGRIALSGVATNDNMDLAGGEPTETIGVGGFVIGNQASRSVWGLYSDVQYEAGSYGYGMEIAMKNKSGVDDTTTPYFLTTGTYGFWMPAGGDNAYGGEATDNCNTALLIGGKRGWTWNKGIVFQSDGITGCDGLSGLGICIEMGAFQAIRWLTPTNNTGGLIRATTTTAGAETTITMANNSIVFNGAALSNLLKLVHNSGGVDGIQIDNSSAATPTISAFGDSTNIDLQLSPKGNGNVMIPIASVATYASDVAAAAGGVPVGGIYRNGSALQIRVS